MTYKKTEKEILKAIVEYGQEEHSMAKVLNKSRLLENRGIVIAFASNRNYIFYDKQKYDWEDIDALSYITELISLINYIIEKRLITLLPINTREVHVLGRQKSRLARQDYIEVDDAMLEVGSNMGNWIDKSSYQQTFWPSCFSEQQLPISKYLECSFSISQELKDLVKHGFKTEEQRRFSRQQWLTWISILVALFIGIASILINKQC